MTHDLAGWPTPLGAAASVNLCGDEVAAIRAEIPHDAGAGPRYNAEELARIGL